MPGQRSHALRRGRWSEPGGIYLLTLVTERRRPCFTDWEAASRIARALSDPHAWPHARLLCWVLMPDHWHGIVQLLDVARYVVANPIRAGLSRTFGGYPYWDAVWLGAEAEPAA